MLDLHGIFVYDERGPNGWRPHVRLFPDAKRRNDVEERSTLKRRRLLLETCDRPEASAPLPRHASKQLHQRRPPTPTIIQTTGPPPPPRSRARHHPPEPKQEGAHEGAAAGGASTTHTTRPEEPQQHTPTWPSWISHTASQHPTGPRGEPGQRNGWTLAPGDWPKESALREHRSMKLRSASCKCNGRCADPTPIRSLPASHNQPCSIFR